MESKKRFYKCKDVAEVFYKSLKSSKNKIYNVGSEI